MSSWFSAGIIPGQDVYGKSASVWGTKPVVPPAVDYAAATDKIIKSDTAALPDLGKLASGATDLYKSMLEKVLPGIGDMMKQGGLDINSLLKGEGPAGLDDYIKRTSAESNAGIGFSSMRETTTGFDTKMKLIDQGLQAAPRWAQMAESQTFDFSKLLLNKEDAMRQSDATWSRDWLQAQITAAPDPGARGDRDASMMALGMMLKMWGGGSYTGGQYNPRSSYKDPNAGMDGSQGYNDWQQPVDTSFFDSGVTSSQLGPESGGGGGMSASEFDFNSMFAL